MKTIHVSAINPFDGITRDNEVLVSRIAGWYTRNRHYFEIRDCGSIQHNHYEGPTTIISLDSGAEYEIAESLISFRTRLGKIVDGSRDFLGRAELTPSGHLYFRGEIHVCDTADCPARSLAIKDS